MIGGEAGSMHSPLEALKDRRSPPSLEKGPGCCPCLGAMRARGAAPRASLRHPTAWTRHLPASHFHFLSHASTMVLTVHHLGRSQSERIVWLCEELGLDYQLKVYDRSPMLAPPELKKLHPSGSAPIITDGDVTLAESGAVMEYILVKYGKGKLVVGSEEKNYADYLYWLHYANGTLQPSLTRTFFMRMAQVPDDNPVMENAVSRREHAIGLVNERLKDNEWLAGSDLTAADIMAVFSLSTMRLFVPYSLESYPNVIAYLKRVGTTEGYKRAMAKGDPGLEPVLGAEAPKPAT